MEYLAFRNLVGVSHTEAEVKAIAEEVRGKSHTNLENVVKEQLNIFQSTVLQWFHTAVCLVVLCLSTAKTSD